MSHRRIPALAVSLLLVLGLTAGTAVAAQTERPVESAPSVGGTANYGDSELIAALSMTNLTQEWIANSPVSAQVSLVEVTGPVSYVDARAQFLTRLEAFDARTEKASARSARLDRVSKQANVAEQTIRQLQRSFAPVDGSAAGLSPPEAHRLRVMLADWKSTDVWPGFSLDPVSRAEHRLSDLTADLRAALAQLPESAVSNSTALEQVAALQQTLHGVDMLSDLARLSSNNGQLELMAERDRLIADMAELHAARTLATSVVAGLSLVTVDAYVQGAASLDASCPVDWTLLAGIGRIESRHGTLDDATVQTSGRVTKSIYGPLLDGGATAREAEEAQLEAEAEVLLAEQQAVEAELAEAEEAYQSSIWGHLAREAAAAGLVTGPDGEMTEAPKDGNPDDGELPLHDPALWGDLQSEAVKSESEPPLHDPALWGDPAVSHFDHAQGEDPADTAEAESDEESEEPEGDREFKGNGFAVIEDSDDGRLDDNSRWDRAVGPMQFIPETWSYWETDGNGDSIADPQNLYDAAASAGRFLCHLSRTKGASPWTFVLGYNSSDTYVRNVMSAAETFRQQELPDLADNS